MSIQSVLIVGGTHGNESSGLALIHPKLQKHFINEFGTLDLHFDIGNPKAVERNTRFTEEDLNRQFTLFNLASENPSFEATQARALNKKWGPKGNAKTDLVIDIHNTTSAMGATLIVLELDAFHIGLARYVKDKMPEANILVEDEQLPSQHPYLCTIGKRGIMVEVGAQPQGVYRADITDLARRMTEYVLAYCAQCPVPDSLPKAEAFRLGEIVYYPTSDIDMKRGGHSWMIHPALQDKDFSELNTGEPVFQSIDGEERYWEASATYPHFINEAAYYRTNVAFATASKITI